MSRGRPIKSQDIWHEKNRDRQRRYTARKPIVDDLVERCDRILANDGINEDGWLKVFPEKGSPYLQYLFKKYPDKLRNETLMWLRGDMSPEPKIESDKAKELKLGLSVGSWDSEKRRWVAIVPSKTKRDELGKPPKQSLSVGKWDRKKGEWVT